MKSKQERQEWIIQYIKNSNGVDVLNSEFVDAYVEHTGAAVDVMMWGANRCKMIGRDLSELNNSGKLSRFRIGISNWQPGFPKWVYSYSLPTKHNPPTIGTKDMSLTFDTLRTSNTARLPQFKNAKGEPAHSEPDGSDWKLSAWCNAVCGELGELANLIKKIERGDMTLEEARGDVSDELADVATYLDLLAFRCDVDLGQATIDKFNRVSDRVGSTVYISTPELLGRD